MRASPPYLPPLDDLRRALAIAARNVVEIDHELANELIEQLGRLAANEIAPTDALGDLLGAALTSDGAVTGPREFVDAYERISTGGWIAAGQPSAIGGGGLGPLVATALSEILASANLALSLCVTLSQGAIELLRRWGSDQQRAEYLAPLVAGRWAGTMLLTEPAAGSDVGALTTRARQLTVDEWELTGTKTFITWGEHDLTENIVHLVLARAPGGPIGTKGISLFLVPKVNRDGTRNTIRCVNLERKLGIHASPTCVMELDRARGELVGGLNGGMAAMFTMMNAARLAMAVQGLSTAERCTQQAIAYATVRQQGRRPGGTPAAQVLIAEHPDVRSMLADLRSTTRAMRILVLRTAAHAHALELAETEEVRAHHRARVDLLTPVAKAWCTDEGFRLASEALQVHGGAGYVEDTGIAQRLRDARVAPIYEGTNGIQAIDLVTRKVLPDRGACLHAVLDDIASGIAGVGTELIEACDAVIDAIGWIRDATAWIVERAGTSPDDALVGARPYLDLIATTVAGALLVALASEALAAGDPGGAEIRSDARWFAANRVRSGVGTLQRVIAGADVLPDFVKSDDLSQSTA